MKQSKKYVKGYFMLADPSVLYKGLYSPEDSLWNGWLSPYFDKDTCEIILKSLGGHRSDNLKWFFLGETFYYQDNQYLEDDPDEWIERKPTLIDGKEYWQIGEWEWVWDLYQEIK